MSRTTAPHGFDRVASIGLRLPGTECAAKYDGSPVLRVRGCFFAGIAGHRSAEPGSIVVRSAFANREWLLADAPETYYVTDYYRAHPVVLARLASVGDDALRDLLSASWRLAIEKRSGRVVRTRRGGAASSRR
jgi:hypothetical protein